MTNRRAYLPHRNKLRNLKQYKDMSDDEFNEVMDKVIEDSRPEVLTDFQKRIDNKLNELTEDYDLTDMKSNDKMQLEALAWAIVQLEDLEKFTYNLRVDINPDTILMLEKVNRIISGLRADISMIQNDLQLTRRVRNQSKETSILDKWQKLTEKARSFWEKKMLYVFCPSCRRLLLNAWLLYPNHDAKITVVCGHCSSVIKLNLIDLYKTENKNLKDVKLP